MDIARNIYLNFWSILHGFYLRVFIQIHLLMEALGLEALCVTSYGPFLQQLETQMREMYFGFQF